MTAEGQDARAPGPEGPGRGPPGSGQPGSGQPDSGQPDSGHSGDARPWSGLLRQIIELSTAERNLRSVVRGVAEFVVATTHADACFVHMVDRDARELVLMGATPDEFDELVGTIRLRLGEGVAGWVARHGEPAVVGDKWNDPRYVYIPALKGEEFSSLISVPLLRPQGVVVGVLNVHSRAPHHFGPADAEHLAEVASVLAAIVENAVLYDRLATREGELERFAARTIELQELDRRRIAANIHDGISQRLVSAWYHLRAARSLAEAPALLAEIENTEALLSDALDEARHAIVGLRPAVLDDLGLTAGITSLASSLGSDAEIVLDLDPCSLPAHVETALFRISQEALQNVMKHAGASHVTISLSAKVQTVVLSISDDGVGFEPGPAAGPLCYGLEGMHERAALIGAKVEVRSRVGQGTSIIVTVPVRAQNLPDDNLGDIRLITGSQFNPPGPADLPR